jgi:WD40 repeat protein
MNDFNISHNGRIMAVVEEIPSPDGSLDKIKSKITVWDLQKTKKVDEKDLKSHDMYVCISPTGKYVTCWDDKNGTLYFWEVGDQLRLLWKNPQRLEVSEMQVGEDTKLDPKNALLLSQLGVNMKK